MHDVRCNGASIPALGFGTWQLRGRTAQALVEAALEIGYRHVDTAQMYGNEAEVGAALKAAGLPREEVFVTTKVWPDHFRRADLARSADVSLARLGLDHVDLFLLHWPNPDVPLAETIEALNAVAGRGQARHIGVSNFNTARIDEAARLSERPLVTNQVEYHPFLGQGPVLDRCRGLGMSLTAYCPLARGRVFADPVLARVASAHGKAPGQVALRWLVQQEGVVAIPRSSSDEHVRANFAINDFELTAAEMAEIDALAKPAGRIVDFASQAPAWDAA